LATPALPCILKLAVFEMKITFQLIRLILIHLIWLSPLLAAAQLVVTVSPPKIVGQMAVVELRMKNDLSEKVESVRAVCFLMNEKGKMAGQSTKWVIGQNHASLEPKAEATFNFVITSSQPFKSTNLTAKVSFVRVNLVGGQLANPTKDIIFELPKKH
jgi:hypothetical protein